MCGFLVSPARSAWARLEGVVCGAVILLLCAAAPASKRQLEEAQRAHGADLAAESAAQAKQAAVDARARLLANQRVAAAARLRLAEQALDQALQRRDDLAARRDAVRARMQEAASALSPLLPLMERLSLFPAETLLAVPAAPDDAVRGVLILGGLARQLRARAAAVAAERAELAALQAQLDVTLPALHAAEQQQRIEAAALDAALEQAKRERSAAQNQADTAAQRAAADAARADTLRAAIAALDAARQAADRAAARQRAEAVRAAAAAAHAAKPPAALAPVPPMAAGRSTWLSPVAGRVVRGFGVPGDAGPAAGMTLQTPPGARVVSPCSGRAAFAAPFRSYGQLVILDCGGDVHIVLAGLGRLDVAAGQAVQRGEPVGVMAQSAAPSLYVELRHGSQPADPAPYLHPAL